MLTDEQINLKENALERQSSNYNAIRVNAETKAAKNQTWDDTSDDTTAERI